MKLPLIAAAAVAFLAAGCTPYGPPYGPPHGPPYGPPHAPPPYGPPHGPPPGADMCRAGQYQYLLGRHRSDIPREPYGEDWRVTCTTCAVTMDHNPRRLNIFYDNRTGIVREVRCG